MNNYKIKFKIGEFSKMCFVTVKTLRHYEKLGLLIPHEVDEWTGYRYYDVSQMDELNMILRLKKLGLSLEEIREMKEEGMETLSGDMIDKALVKANDEMCQLRHRISELEQMKGIATKNKTMNNLKIKPIQGGTVACFRKRLKSYDELGPLGVNVIGPEMKRLGCVCPEETAYCFTMDYNKNFDPNDIDLEYCEIVSEHGPASDIISFKEIPVVDTAVCYSHYGAYQTCSDSMAEIFKYIESHDLEIADHPRFSYIHGVWDCDSVEDWLTEIQVPVKKRNNTI